MESRNRRTRSNNSHLLPPPLRTTHTADARPPQLEIRVVPWTNGPDAQAGAATAATLQRLEGQLQSMADTLAAAKQAEAERAARLHQLGEQLAERKRELVSMIGRIERARYRRMIDRLHRLVVQNIPRGSVIAVVSRGDDQLITIPGRRGWHFPQTSDGVYAGHHPADSDAAIALVEDVRARGARYLVVPRTAFWWLDHYHRLDAYLRRTTTCLVRDEHTAALFALPARRVRR